MIVGLIFVGIASRVLWDGDQNRIGVGWVGGQCKKASIKTVDGSIRFHTTDPKTFAEWGWQWAPWSPKFEGTDLRPYRSLLLELRVTGPKLPTDLLLSLASPGDHHLTVNLPLLMRDPKLMDGSWRTLHVPIADLKARDTKFDLTHTIQVIFGVWVETGDFTVDLRRIELEGG